MAIKQYIIFSNDEFKSVWNKREHWSAILPDTKARIIKLSYESWLYEYLMRKSFCLKTKKQVNVKKKSARSWLPFSLYHKLHHLPICSSDINPSLSDICLETFFFSSLKLSAWKIIKIMQPFSIYFGKMYSSKEFCSNASVTHVH